MRMEVDFPHPLRDARFARCVHSTRVSDENDNENERAFDSLRACLGPYGGPAWRGLAADENEELDRAQRDKFYCVL